MSTGRKFRAIPGSEWLLSTEDCVSCPECAFTFDAMHCDDDGLTYTCPCCSEQEWIRKCAKESQRCEIAEARAVRAEAARGQYASVAIAAQRMDEALTDAFGEPGTTDNFDYAHQSLRDALAVDDLAIYRVDEQSLALSPSPEEPTG